MSPLLWALLLAPWRGTGRPFCMYGGGTRRPDGFEGGRRRGRGGRGRGPGTFSPLYRSALRPRLLRRALHRGTPMAIRILNDLLLFSCLSAFVTGIVLAAASLL